MPSEPLPFDRKDLLKERKPSSSDSVGIVPTRWREPSSTPSPHNNHGFSDFRRHISAGSGPHESTYMNNTRVSVVFLDTKIEAEQGNNTLESPSGDVAYCVTPGTADDASSRKKPRLGWGEGLAKYERKKVDVGSRSEPLLPRSSNLTDKTPSLTGYSDCASPTTSYSFACSSSPGLEQKATTLDANACNPSVVSCHVSHKYIEGSALNLENLEAFNFSSSLDELLQRDDVNALGSGFVTSTSAMDKLQVWKADITKALEITESEIDSLENELKSLISNVGGSCLFPAASTSFLAECNNKIAVESCGPLLPRNISSGHMHVGSPENFTGAKNLYGESVGMETYEFMEPIALCNNVMCSDAVEQRDSAVSSGIRSEIAKCSVGHVSDDMLGIVSTCGKVHYGREAKLYNSILDTNKIIAQRVSDEFNKILPRKSFCNNIRRVSNELQINKKIAKRKRFLKFKERVMALKFRAFQYSWREDLRLLSMRRSGAKSHKKFEFGYSDCQTQNRSSLRCRLSSPAGILNLFETTEVLDYSKKLLQNSRVMIYRSSLKMPSYILDRRERMTSRFISDNRLVENPIDVEKERSIVNPWTAEEKEIFLEKYSLFGKNFKKIASFLEDKTIADCVQFYYKNHKSDHFQKTKKKSVFVSEKSGTSNTYLVTSGRRLNRETGATSLEMLGAASTIVANVDDEMPRQQKCTPNLNVGHTSSSCGGDSISESSIPMLCNEQETVAADVLAGICRSISSEALGSCITSSGDVHHQDGIRCQKLGGTSKRLHLAPEGSSLNDVEGNCSDDSCVEEMESSDWTDEEKSSFIKAVRIYAKNFSMISQCMRTRSSDQCRVFFSKSRKRLRLDVIDLECGSEGNQGGGSEDDHEDSCMAHSGSVISRDKLSLDGKTDIEDLHSSDIKEEHDAESDQNLVNGCEAETKPEVGLVGDMNDNLEGAADSEAVNMEEVVQNTHSQGCAGDMNSSCASGAGFEADTVAMVYSKITTSDHELVSGNASTVRGLGCCEVEDLNSSSQQSLDLSTVVDGSIVKLNASGKVIASEEPGNCFLMSNLLPQDLPTNRKTDDVSRVSFRKANDRRSQRSSSTDGYHLHLPKHSLLDCVESSQVLRGYPVNERMDGSLTCNNETNRNFKLDLTNGFIQKGRGLRSDGQEEMHSAPDVEKSSRRGDVKLFGQILTKCSSQQRLRESDQSNHEEKTNSFNLKFDNKSAADRRSASLDFGT